MPDVVLTTHRLVSGLVASARKCPYRWIYSTAVRSLIISDLVRVARRRENSPGEAGKWDGMEEGGAGWGGTPVDSAAGGWGGGRVHAWHIHGGRD